MRSLHRTRMSPAAWNCAMKRLLTWNGICGGVAITLYLLEKINP